MSANVPNLPVDEWHWCDACQSYHADKNPTCLLFIGELHADDEVVRLRPQVLMAFGHLPIIADPAIPPGVIAVVGKNWDGEPVRRVFRLADHGRRLEELTLPAVDKPLT